MPKEPPGQNVFEQGEWPVLDLGQTPEVSTERWRLVVDGARRDAALALLGGPPRPAAGRRRGRLPLRHRLVDPRHRLPRRALRDRSPRSRARRAEATHVMSHAHDGYSTNLPLEEALKPDVLLVHAVDGAAALRRARRAGPGGGPAALGLEGREVGEPARVPAPRPARLLGDPRVLEHGAPVARRPDVVSGRRARRRRYFFFANALEEARRSALDASFQSSWSRRARPRRRPPRCRRTTRRCRSGASASRRPRPPRGPRCRPGTCPAISSAFSEPADGGQRGQVAVEQDLVQIRRRPPRVHRTRRTAAATPSSRVISDISTLQRGQSMTGTGPPRDRGAMRSGTGGQASAARKWQPRKY